MPAHTVQLCREIGWLKKCITLKLCKCSSKRSGAGKKVPFPPPPSLLPCWLPPVKIGLQIINKGTVVLNKLPYLNQDREA